MSNIYQSNLNYGNSVERFDPFYNKQENCCNNNTIAEPTSQNCCCKESMRKALKLLCNSELTELIDFDKFAFLTNSFIVGTKLVLLKIGSDEKDNLGKLEGSFKQFSNCNCDLIDISGTAVYDVPIPVSLKDLAEQVTELIKSILEIIGNQTGFLATLAEILREFLKIFDPFDFNEELLQAILDFLIKYFTTLPMVDKASLCAVNAIAFQTKWVDGSEELREKNYKRAKSIFIEQLGSFCKNDCDKCECNCDCDDCCCVKGVMNDVLNSNFSHKVTLTAGNLTLREATVLGRVNNVLVLANDKKYRFYFVCADQVQFID